MSRFAAALHRTARALDLPPRLRAEILLELSADLESAYEDQRARGLGDEEAARRAEELVLGPPEMIRRLVRLHADTRSGPLQGLGARLSEGTSLVLLAVAVAPLLLASGWVAGSGLWGQPSSPLVWALLLAGVSIAALAVREGVRLAAGGVPAGRRLSLLLLLSAVAPALGLLALTIGLHSVAMQLSGVADGAQGGLGAAEQVRRDGSLLVAGLLLGLAGALSWFALEEGASIRATRAAAALLEDEPRPHPEARSDIIPLIERRKA